MTNNMKEIIKDFIYGTTMFILTLFLPILIFINSILCFEYFKHAESVMIHYKDCDYWKNNSIPENLTVGKKWKLITTIGECNITDKKYFLEQNINDINEYNINGLFPVFDLKHKSYTVGEQAQNYLQDFNGIENPKNLLRNFKENEVENFLKDSN